MTSAFDGFLQSRREAVLQLLLVAGILVCLTYLANETVWRLDLTENNQYTLSEVSQEVASGLDDPVTVKAYFSDDLPPQLARVKEQFRRFLEEFSAYAEGNVEYEFVNPNASDQAEQKAQQAGVRPVTVNVRQQDQLSSKRAYLGAVFSYGDQEEAVPLIQPQTPIEYSIASTVRRLTVEDKPQVGVLQGHGEPSLQAMQQLAGQLRKRYKVTTVSGIDTAGVPPETQVLMVVRPTRKLSEAELRALDQYVMRGGRVVFALNRVRTNLQRGFARAQRTGLDTLLSSYGVRVEPTLVRDWNGTRIGVRQRIGGFPVVRRVRYPYIPKITRFAEHPATKGLETAVFQFVSTVGTTQIDTSRQAFTRLAESSQRSEAARQPFNLSPSQNWRRIDFSGGTLPVAAAIEGIFTSPFAGSDTTGTALAESQQTRLVVIGDGDFVVNGDGGGRRGRPQQSQQQRLPSGNINLMAGVVDYLAGETGLLALRTKRVTSRPLPTMEPFTKTLLKYLNVLLPILLVLGYGLFRYRRNRARRRRWREQGV